MHLKTRISRTERSITKISKEGRHSSLDFLAIEEPLEIRLRYYEKEELVEKSLSITMRTPGDDANLAIGFLITEGIVQSLEQIENIEISGLDPNIVILQLSQDLELDLGRLERHFYTSSSCGVCGKTSMDALRSVGCKNVAELDIKVIPDLIQSIPSKMRKAQKVFEDTGGLHAAGFFSSDGHLLLSKEDVGRHNALDKLIGAYLTKSGSDFSRNILLVSGRASFELVQKALMAGVAIMAAVGAPSSLAVELAEEYGMTLLGFVNEYRFNIYTQANRILYS